MSIICSAHGATPFLGHIFPDAILTPHIAGSTGPEVCRMGTRVGEDARRYLAGEPLRHRFEYDRLTLLA